MAVAHVTPQKAHTLQLMLKLTYGLLFIAAGADKFTNIITHWSKYLSPTIAQFLPISPAIFMYIVGIFEIIVGVGILMSHWTKKAALIATGWLMAIVLNLVTMGTLYDIAVRDTVMAVGAYILSQLSAE